MREPQAAVKVGVQGNDVRGGRRNSSYDKEGASAYEDHGSTHVADDEGRVLVRGGERVGRCHLVDLLPQRYGSAVLLGD